MHPRSRIFSSSRRPPGTLNPRQKCCGPSLRHDTWAAQQARHERTRLFLHACTTSASRLRVYCVLTRRLTSSSPRSSLTRYQTAALHAFPADLLLPYAATLRKFLLPGETMWTPLFSTRAWAARYWSAVLHASPASTSFSLMTPRLPGILTPSKT